MDAFYAGGRAEVAMLLPPAFKRLGFDSAGKRILEIGCGPGRLFPGHAEFFSEVWGIDVSPEMVRLGEELCPVEARFILGSGYDLREVEDDSIDYCFSYLVFHHLPYEDVAWAYFKEIRRVLRPGMCFQVQLLGPAIASGPRRARSGIACPWRCEDLDRSHDSCSSGGAGSVRARLPRCAHVSNQCLGLLASRRTPDERRFSAHIAT